MKAFENISIDRQSPLRSGGEAMTLATLPVGVRARIIAVEDSSQLARRLIEMGVVPGAQVEVVRTAPLGDPLQILVRGYYLALRRNEARAIAVRTEVNGAT